MASTARTSSFKQQQQLARDSFQVALGEKQWFADKLGKDPENVFLLREYEKAKAAMAVAMAELKSIGGTLTDPSPEEQEPATKKRKTPTKATFSAAESGHIAQLGINMGFSKRAVFDIEEKYPKTLNPPDWLRTYLQVLHKHWFFYNEAGRRTVISAILAAALHHTHHEFTEEKGPAYDAVPMSYLETPYEQTRNEVTLTGKIDYILGMQTVSQEEPTPDNAGYMVAVEAEVMWHPKNVMKAVAEAAAVWAASKEHFSDSSESDVPVFGVLTNALEWQFLCIDEAGLLYASKIMPIHANDQQGLDEVFAFLVYLIKKVVILSPCNSRDPSFSSTRAEELQSLRRSLSL